MKNRYDVVVVGGRCAGAAVAMLLSRAGLSVLVVEKGREGTDTLSTHALMRAAILLLSRWGALENIQKIGTPVVRTTTFHYADEVIPVHLKVRDGIEGLYAPRRFVIDKILVEAARNAGAELAFGTTLTDLRRGSDGRVCGVVVKGEDGVVKEIDARHVVGADGMYSTVASLVGARTSRTAAHTTAVIYNYFSDLGLDGYHWYYRPGVSAGAIQTNDGMTCVFAAMPPKRFEEEMSRDVVAGHQQILVETDADLAERVARSPKKERYRGFGGLKGWLRECAGPGWALVGDAAYFKDPLTAHGMTDALIDAEYLARALIDGSDAALETYQRERDARSIAFFEITDGVASFEWDIPVLQKLHRSLSEEMKREAADVLALYGAA